MSTSRRGSFTRILVAMVIAVLLASCGQKGDLYLPEDQQSALPHSHVDT